MDAKSKGLLQKLEQKFTLLLRDLKDYSDAKLNEQPNPDSWSVLQIMQHLLLVEKAGVAYTTKKISFDPVLEKAGVMSSVRSRMSNLMAVTPFRLKAPEQVSGDVLLTDLTFWEVAKQWKGSRSELKHFLSQLPEDHFKAELYNHPVIGKMKLSGMLHFFDKHFDRHHRQIKRTLKKIDAVKQV